MIGMLLVGMPSQKSDFSTPTGEDKMDKTILPKVMEVKHFGHNGRTKWTHLVAKDTTKWDNLYMFFLSFFFFLSSWNTLINQGLVVYSIDQ